MRDIQHLSYNMGNEGGCLLYTPVFGIAANIDNNYAKVTHFINGGIAWLMIISVLSQIEKTLVK